MDFEDNVNTQLSCAVPILSQRASGLTTSISMDSDDRVQLAALMRCGCLLPARFWAHHEHLHGFK